MKIVQPRLIETDTLGDIMAVRIPKEMLVMHDEDWEFFLDLKQVETLGITSLDLETLRSHKALRHYIYYTGDIVDLVGPKSLLAEDCVHRDKFFDDLNTNTAQNVLKILRNRNFDTKFLVYFYTDAYLWYTFRSSFPLSPTYRIDYIGGVTNEDYDLRTAEKILKQHPWVSRVKKIKIPYYNAHSGHTHAIEFNVRLPQEEHDKLVRHYGGDKPDDKDGGWTCRIKDSLATPYALEPFDVLGLKAALLKKRSRSDEEE